MLNYKYFVKIAGRNMNIGHQNIRSFWVHNSCSNYKYCEPLCNSGKLDNYLSSERSLEVQVTALDSACQAQKKMADEQDAASLGRPFYLVVSPESQIA